MSQVTHGATSRNFADRQLAQIREKDQERSVLLKRRAPAPPKALPSETKRDLHEVLDLTADEVAEFKTLFQIWTKGTQQMDSSTLTRHLRSCGFISQNMTDEDDISVTVTASQVCILFAHSKSKTSARLSYTEFLAFLSQLYSKIAGGYPDVQAYKKILLEQAVTPAKVAAKSNAASATTTTARFMAPTISASVAASRMRRGGPRDGNPMHPRAPSLLNEQPTTKPKTWTPPTKAERLQRENANRKAFQLFKRYGMNQFRGHDLMILLNDVFGEPPVDIASATRLFKRLQIAGANSPITFEQFSKILEPMNLRVAGSYLDRKCTSQEHNDEQQTDDQTHNKQTLSVNESWQNSQDGHISLSRQPIRPSPDHLAVEAEDSRSPNPTLQTPHPERQPSSADSASVVHIDADTTAALERVFAEYTASGDVYGYLDAVQYECLLAAADLVEAADDISGRVTVKEVHEIFRMHATEDGMDFENFSQSLYSVAANGGREFLALLRVISETPLAAAVDHMEEPPEASTPTVSREPFMNREETASREDVKESESQQILDKEQRRELRRKKREEKTRLVAERDARRAQKEQRRLAREASKREKGVSGEGNDNPNRSSEQDTP